MFIEREIQPELERLRSLFPVVTITGPRQSGKTTLLKHAFPGDKYFSLEDPEIREFARTDPRSFLKPRKGGMIIDEIQIVPDLVSYIQGYVDETNEPGMFLLSGSQQFELTRSISQSLAGRTAILRLLPFNISEAYSNDSNVETDDILFNGFYPRIFDQNIDATTFYRSYFETYLRRDLNEFISVRDINQFQKFIRLCAGRIGQIFIASNLADEVGVSVKTIQSWLSVLEASYIVFMLHPYYSNINKRLIKSQKLYFYDVGLASYLLGITSADQLATYPLRGPLFENLVILELKKYFNNRGTEKNLHFFRDSHQNEVDILIDHVHSMDAMEIKSSKTFHQDLVKGLDYIKNLLNEKINVTMLCFDGTMNHNFKGHRVFNFRSLAKLIASLE